MFYFFQRFKPGTFYTRYQSFWIIRVSPINSSTTFPGCRNLCFIKQNKLLTDVILLFRIHYFSSLITLQLSLIVKWWHRISYLYRWSYFFCCICSVKLFTLYITLFVKVMFILRSNYTWRFWFWFWMPWSLCYQFFWLVPTESIYWNFRSNRLNRLLFIHWVLFIYCQLFNWLFGAIRLKFWNNLVLSQWFITILTLRFNIIRAQSGGIHRNDRFTSSFRHLILKMFFGCRLIWIFNFDKISRSFCL